LANFTSVIANGRQKSMTMAMSVFMMSLLERTHPFLMTFLSHPRIPTLEANPQWAILSQITVTTQP
jgi:hypothetical protein